MKTNRYESGALSAVMDGESDELDLQYVLNDLGQPHSNYRDKALRYQKIGDIMRRQYNDVAYVDVSSTVIKHILAEDSTACEQPKSTHRFSLISKGAIAASFVTAALVGLNGYDYSLILNSNTVPEAAYTQTENASEWANTDQYRSVEKSHPAIVNQTLPDKALSQSYSQKLDEYMKIHTNNPPLYDVTESVFPLVQIMHFGEN